MKYIKGLEVPEQLIELIQYNIWPKISLENISDIVPFLKEPMVILKSLDSISSVSNNKNLLSIKAFGIRSSKLSGEVIAYPFLDFDKSLIIAVNKYPGDDIAIALDYRDDLKKPKVRASDFSSNYPFCEWRLLADTFDDFWKRINNL